MPDIDTKTGDMVYTPAPLNYAFFAGGMLIIWLCTHNWGAMIGGFVASIHVRLRVRR